MSETKRIAGDRKCPKCGTVMCEQSDERPGPNGITLCTPQRSIHLLSLRREGGEVVSEKREDIRKEPRRPAEWWYMAMWLTQILQIVWLIGLLIEVEKLRHLR